MRLLATLLAALSLFVVEARADYQVKDGNGTSQTIKAGLVAGSILPWYTLTDPSANTIVYAPGASDSSISGLLALCDVTTTFQAASKLSPCTMDTAGNIRVLATQAGTWILGAPAANTYVGNVSSESVKATYKYSSLGNTPAATPTDVLTITGSGTKTVRITKIVVGGSAGTAGQLNPLLIRRSAADSGGASTTPTLLKRDTSDGVATAVVALYTANPAGLGATVGTLDSCRLLLNLTTAVPDVCQFTFGVNNDKEIVLRGTSDILAVNFNGAAVPASGTLDFDVEWTEE